MPIISDLNPSKFGEHVIEIDHSNITKVMYCLENGDTSLMFLSMNVQASAEIVCACHAATESPKPQAHLDPRASGKRNIYLSLVPLTTFGLIYTEEYME